MRATAGAADISNIVDLYDSGTGQWSTAQLSLARVYLSATSVGTVAMFAGGLDFNPATAVSAASNRVDLYDSGTGLWSTAQLSLARWLLSASSVGAVAIFAGGSLDGKLLRIVFVCCVSVD